MILLEITKQIAIRIYRFESIVHNLITIIVYSVENLTQSGRSELILIITVLKPIPSILVIIRIGQIWITLIGQHFNAIIQSIIIGITIQMISEMCMIFRPIEETVPIRISEVETLVSHTVAIVIYPIENLRPSRIDHRILIITVVEMIEQIPVIVWVECKRVTAPEVNLRSVCQAIIVSIAVKRIRTEDEYFLGVSYSI